MILLEKTEAVTTLCRNIAINVKPRAIRYWDGQTKSVRGVSLFVFSIQATELDLATCWICNFDPERTKELLNLPDHLEPLVLLPVGYPLDASDPDRHDDQRKSLSEIVSFEIS